MKRMHYVWLSILLLGASALVTVHHEKNPANAHSQNGNGVQLGDQQNTYSNSPSWDIAYDAFGFPGGIAVWALFFTLVAIADQSYHTARAAKATEDSLVHAKDTIQVQLRAYLSVTIGSADYQVRDKNIKFAAAPVLINSGSTPARKVVYTHAADILSDPLPEGYVFAPAIDRAGPYVLGTNQPVVMLTVVEDFVDDKDVLDIMSATHGQALYCWGKITYEDFFGKGHTAEFCHRMYFYPSPKEPGEFKVGGNYMAGKNESD